MRYEPDYRSFGELVRSDMFLGVLKDRAEEGRQYAISIAPYDENRPPSETSPRYRNSFEIHPSVGFDGRKAVDLVNTAPHAIFVELRSNVLQQALDYMSDL